MNNKLTKKQQILIGVFITLSVLFATFFFYFYQLLFSPNFKVEKDDYYLLIPTGAKYITVVDSLRKNKILDDELSFNFLAKIMGYQDHVIPGRYLIGRKMNNSTLIRILRSGKQTELSLVFNSARLKKEIASRLCKNLEADSTQFLNLINDPETCKKYGFDTTNIMCMFIPNTYKIYWNTNAEDLLKRMNKEYLDFWTEEKIKKAKEIGFSPIQVSILASIVGSETNKNDEKPRIAGVYINRMKSAETGFKLQADPTVIYGLKDFTIKRVTRNHLLSNTPYNTYLIKGLPPGPINTPGIASIDAVLNFEKNDFLYFVVKSDFSGYHVFSNNYQEHLQNARLYWEALNLRKIK